MGFIVQKLHMENAASGIESVYSLSNTTEIQGGEAMAVTFPHPQHMLGSRTVLFHAAISRHENGAPKMDLHYPSSNYFLLLNAIL